MPSIRVSNPNCNNRSINVYFGLDHVVPLNKKGDNKYVFIISTKAKDADGNVVAPIYMADTSVNGFFKALPKAIAKLCSYVDWGTEYADSDHPYVDYYSPSGSDVSLFSSVIVMLKDGSPSSGIDVDSISITVNGFDVTSDAIIDGTYDNVRVSWSPKRRVLNG